LETHSVTTQQLQTIILVALVANAALIVFALLSMRGTRSRAGDNEELDVKATHDTMLAMAAAGTGALSPSTTATADGPELTHRLSGRPSSNGSAAPADDDPPDEVAGEAARDDAEDDNQAGDERAGEAVVLLDSLTGLESPIAWRRAVGEEVLRLGRYRRTATVMLIELDGFERLVEQLGEAAGARLEIATARTLGAQARASDRCARLGRGRFAILLPETDEIKAINFGERIRSECDRWLEAGEVALRLAIGWAIVDPTAGATPAIHEAGRRLDVERRQPTGSPA
jgi:diguanylate cyclase (GGDEF)-like protein